jgi:hypothetical protein
MAGLPFQGNQFNQRLVPRALPSATMDQPFGLKKLDQGASRGRAALASNLAAMLSATGHRPEDNSVGLRATAVAIAGGVF